MKKSIFILVPMLFLGACGHQKTYVVGKDAFCTGLEENSEEPVFCVDDKNAPINGRVVEYYPNGNLLRDIPMINGRENGIEKEYYENGNLRVESNVIEGKATGISKLYNENGKLYMEMKWVDGDVTDIKAYDESGNVIE